MKKEVDDSCYSLNMPQGADIDGYNKNLHHNKTKVPHPNNERGMHADSTKIMNMVMCK
jgi:hypothetical protein